MAGPPLDAALIPHLAASGAKEVNAGGGSNFFAAFRFLSRDRREALSAFYAFCRVIDDCVDEIANPADRERALAYWKGELDALYEGKPRHPLMRELAAAVHAHAIPKKPLDGLIEGCAMDVRERRYETFADLYEYCYRVAGLVGLVCLKIFGGAGETLERAAVDLGVAFQLTNILRDVGEDLRRGRIYLPEEDLRRFGYSEDELRRGVENAAFRELMEFQYARAEAYYAKALPAFASDPGSKLSAARAMARVYAAILKKIRRRGYPVLKERVRLNAAEKALCLLPLLWGR